MRIRMARVREPGKVILALIACAFPVNRQNYTGAPDVHRIMKSSITRHNVTGRRVPVIRTPHRTLVRSVPFRVTR